MSIDELAKREQNLYTSVKELEGTIEEKSDKIVYFGISKNYRENTQEARASGIFGAPSFQVLDEIFWGDDRLDDAVEYYNSIL